MRITTPSAVPLSEDAFSFKCPTAAVPQNRCQRCARAEAAVEDTVQMTKELVWYKQLGGKAKLLLS